MTDIGKVSGSIVVTDQFSKTFGKFGKGMQVASKGMKVAAVGAAAVGAALAAATLKALNFADAMDNQAKSTQANVESLQVYNNAAEQAGQSSASITTAIQRLQRGIGDPTEIIEESVAKLGLSIQNLKQLDPAAQFETILKSLGDIPNEAEKTAVAMNLLGRSGASLLALSGDALPALNERFRELGFIMDADVIAKVDKAEERMDLLKRTIGGTFNNIGAGIAQADAFSVAIETTTNIIGAFSTSISGSDNAITDWVNGAIAFATDNIRILSLVFNEIIGFVSKFGSVFVAVSDVMNSPLQAIQGNIDSWNNLGEAMDIIDEKTTATATTIQTAFVEAAASVEAMSNAQDNLVTSSEEVGPSLEQVAARTQMLNDLYAAGVVALQNMQLEELNWAEITAEATEMANESFGASQEAVNLLETDIGGLATATESAFERAGIKTKTQLAQTAQQALDDFNTIQATGEATAEGLLIAWQNYLEARGELEETSNEMTKLSMVGTLEAASSALGKFAGDSKAAAIGQAAVDAALAIIKVFATTPFPLNFVVAGAVAAATAIQIGKIKSAKTGFRGGTPGLDFQDFGPGTQTTLHGQEAVVPESGVGDLAGQIASAMGSNGASNEGGGTFILEVDGIAFGQVLRKVTKDGRGWVHSSSVRTY